MRRGTRVLIASASTGNGHLRAGDALLKAIQYRRPDWKVEHVDVLTRAPGWVRMAYSGGFELLAAHAPRVWGGLYRWSDGPDGDPAYWGALAERTVFRSFRRLLQNGAWDVCICTHFLPAQVAAGRPGMPPFALVVTDYTLHRYWAQPRVTRYFVPNDGVATGLRERIPGAVVDATGIPVDPGMLQNISGTDARERLQLDPSRPVLLLMGGGLGVGLEANLAATLSAQLNDAQVLVVCGRNLSAQYRLTSSHPGLNVRVFGFVQRIEQLMACADLIITKPGGLTTSEALAMGKPMLLTRGLPGHEAANARTLVESGVARSVETADELRDTLTMLLQHPEQLSQLSSAATWHAGTNGADLIASLIERDLKERLAA